MLEINIKDYFEELEEKLEHACPDFEHIRFVGITRYFSNPLVDSVQYTVKELVPSGKISYEIPDYHAGLLYELKEVYLKLKGVRELKVSDYFRRIYREEEQGLFGSRVCEPKIIAVAEAWSKHILEYRAKITDFYRTITKTNAIVKHTVVCNTKEEVRLAVVSDLGTRHIMDYIKYSDSNNFNAFNNFFFPDHSSALNVSMGAFKNLQGIKSLKYELLLESTSAEEKGLIDLRKFMYGASPAMFNEKLLFEILEENAPTAVVPGLLYDKYILTRSESVGNWREHYFRRNGYNGGLLEACVLEECVECGQTFYRSSMQALAELDDLLSTPIIPFNYEFVDEQDKLDFLNYLRTFIYEETDPYDFDHCDYCDSGASYDEYEEDCDEYLEEEIRQKASDISEIDYEPLSFGINYYDYSPSRFNFLNIPSKDEKTPRLYMGVELELDKAGKSDLASDYICTALSKRNQDRCYAMSDGSLHNGFEIATMPATLNAHKELFDQKKAFTIASKLGYRSHDTRTCGIHVHINRAFFGPKEATNKRMVKGAILALVMERLWDQFVRFSRRDYSSLRDWANKKELITKLKKGDNTSAIENKFREEYSQGRYVALNATKRNTFELRIFRGTLKYESYMAILELVHNLAYWVRDHNLNEAQQVTFRDIVNYKETEYLEDYCIERGIFDQEDPEETVFSNPQYKYYIVGVKDFDEHRFTTSCFYDNPRIRKDMIGLNYRCRVRGEFIEVTPEMEESQTLKIDNTYLASAADRPVWFIDFNDLVIEERERGE